MTLFRRFDERTARLQNVSPVALAFCLSLLLSAIAYLDDPVINKDGILYIDTARIFLQDGFLKTVKHFDWPWFSMLIGASHWLVGFSFDVWARIWCALFMAGSCSLLVASVRARLPNSGHWACLVALAMPAFNQFRGEVLREFGFWFFSLLTLRLVQRWQENPGWLAALFVHLAILAAAAFRLEALVLVPALFLWQAVESMRDRDWRGFLQINALPLLGLVAAIGWIMAAGEGMHSRVARYLKLINPLEVVAEFREISTIFGEAVLKRFSQEDAGVILFFGVLAALFLKFIKLLGPFAVPLLFRRARTEIRRYWHDFQPALWIWALYFVMIVLFFVRRQYFISRWVSFLDLLFVPLAVVAMMWLYHHHRKLAKFLVLVSLVVMFDNVVSLSAKKTHYIEAGKWLSANLPPGENIYYDDPRISYYAGWGFPRKQIKRDAALSPEHAGKYRYFVLEAKAGDPALQQWLQLQHKRVLADFANKKGSTVLVIGE